MHACNKGFLIPQVPDLSKMRRGLPKKMGSLLGQHLSWIFFLLACSNVDLPRITSLSLGMCEQRSF